MYSKRNLNTILILIKIIKITKYFHYMQIDCYKNILNKGLTSEIILFQTTYMRTKQCGFALKALKSIIKYPKR